MGLYARQDCSNCNQCRDLSLPLQGLSYTKSQRRLRKKNQDLCTNLEDIYCDDRILELYNNWQLNRQPS